MSKTVIIILLARKYNELSKRAFGYEVKARKAKTAEDWCHWMNLWHKAFFCKQGILNRITEMYHYIVPLTYVYLEHDMYPQLDTSDLTRNLMTYEEVELANWYTRDYDAVAYF